MEPTDRIWRGETPRCWLPLLLVLAGLVPAIEGLWLRPAAAGQKPPAATGESVRADTRKKGNRAMSGLAIELRLAKEAYDTRESANATIVFRNKGKSPIKFPMIEGDLGILFFDFAIIGSMGTQFLTNHGQAWGDPSVKEVKLIQLASGKTHTVRLRNVLPFQAFDAGQFRGEQFKVVAVYRDHSYGHSPTYPEFAKKDPAVWKGILFSNPATIKRITRGEDAQRIRSLRACGGSTATIRRCPPPAGSRLSRGISVR